MILDGSHRKWCLASLLLLMLAGGAYVAYARTALGGPRGGSVPGLLFGIAGSVLMIYAGLIGLRKRLPTWRIGSAQTWLRGHIWLGLLSVPLILFHAGFRLGGLVEQALLLVLAAIVASGLMGLALQQLLPRQMTARVPLETFFAQIPFECRLLQLEGDVTAAAVCGPLPVEPDEEVATTPRLKALGVTTRDRHQPLLAVIYRLSPAADAPPPADKPTPVPKHVVAAASPEPSETTQADVQPAEIQPDHDEKTTKPLSAGDKIALMRSMKRTTPNPAEDPIAKEEKFEAEQSPKATMTSAEKIALMRAAKRPAPAAETVPVADQPKPSLSAAEKIALMRGAKAAKPAATTEPAEPSPPDQAVPAAEGVPAKLSAAEKIAMMRAKSKPVAAVAEGAADTATKTAPAAKPAKKVPATTQRDRAPVDEQAQQRTAESVRKFYLESVRPFLAYRSRARGALASDVDAGGVFAAVGAGLPEEMRPALDRLMLLCDKRRQLSTQERIHRWLHGWSLVHVPLSLALLGLGIVHTIVSLYY